MSRSQASKNHKLISSKQIRYTQLSISHTLINFKTFKLMRICLRDYMSNLSPSRESLKKIVIYSRDQNALEIPLKREAFLRGIKDVQVSSDFIEVYFYKWVDVDRMLTYLKRVHTNVLAGLSYEHKELFKMHQENVKNSAYQDKTHGIDANFQAHSNFEFSHSPANTSTIQFNQTFNSFSHSTKYEVNTRVWNKSTQFVDVVGMQRKMTNDELHNFFGKYNPEKINQYRRVITIKCFNISDSQRLVKDMNGLALNGKILKVKFSNEREFLLRINSRFNY